MRIYLWRFVKSNAQNSLHEKARERHLHGRKEGHCGDFGGSLNGDWWYLITICCTFASTLSVKKIPKSILSITIQKA